MRTSANEELSTMAENDPLTGYEPNFIDNYHETTDIFIQESSSDGKPLNLHDLEFDDYTIGRALSSPLFQEREDPGSREVNHAPDESLGVSYLGQSYFGQAYLGQPLFRPGLSTIESVFVWRRRSTWRSVEGRKAGI